MTVLVTPDGRRYLTGDMPRPFHYRWLLPTVLQDRVGWWVVTTRCALVALCPLGYLYGGGGARGLFVAAAPLGCAGVWRFNWRFPVLVDATAMCFAFAAAVVAPHNILCAVLLAAVAGTMKESAPAFAALYAWNPWLLAGLVPVAVRAAMHAAPSDDPILRHPVAASLEFHKGRWTDSFLWLLPWGTLLAGLYAPSWQVAAVCVVAYGQCVFATDTCRLYQWAWPVLALAAARALPDGWLALAAAVNLFNPFAGDGL